MKNRAAHRIIAERVLPGIAAAAILLWLAAGAAQAFDEALEEQAVRELFEQGLAGAFAALDVERILDYYADSALIVTHAMGRGDKNLFRKTLEGDFSRLEKTEEAIWEVESVEFENEIATAKVRIRSRSVTRAGNVLNRGANFYYRLMKAGDRWQILMQSYRADFGVTPVHGGPGGGPVHPAPPAK